MFLGLTLDGVCNRAKRRGRLDNLSLSFFLFRFERGEVDSSSNFKDVVLVLSLYLHRHKILKTKDKTCL